MITLKFSIAFIIAIVLLALKQEIWVVLASLTAVIALLFEIPMKITLRALLTGTLGYSTIHLVIVVWLIISFGEALYRSGYLQEFVDSVEGLFSDLRVAFIIPSMIIGLLPMPSGAMLSAPLAEEIGKKMKLSPEKLTFFNYWFRHIWEYTWPLYPGLILASAITGVPIWKIGLHQAPMIIFSAGVGLFMLFRKVPYYSVPSNGRKREKFLRFLFSLWPIYLIILFVLIFKLDLVIGLSIILLSLFVLKKFSRKDILGSSRKGLSLKIFLILIFVMIFKRELELSGVMNHLPDELVRWGFSPVIPLVLIPFLVGFLTGVNSAYIGVGFPVLLGILGKNLNYIFIGYVSGFMGILLSPAHLCLAVTKTYFKADTVKLYKLLFPSVLALYLLFWAYMLIVRVL